MAQSLSKPRPRRGAVPTDGTLRERNDAEICGAAIGMFLERGYDSVTMDAVARAAGIAKATVYAHFSSKEDLFTTVMTREMRRVSDSIWKPVSESDDVADVLRRVAQNYFTTFSTERTFLALRAISGVIARFPALGRSLFESGPAVLLVYVTRFLETVDAQGQLRIDDPKLAANQFLSLVRCDLDMRGLLYLELPSQSDINKNTEAAVAMILDTYKQRDVSP